MAGVKETPRQRMIGMMYLVLTALLALQVSNQILQKFVLINDGMERTSRNFILKNESTVGSIEYTVEQQGNNEKDVPKVAAAQQVRETTKEIYSYLEDLKQQLITQSNAKNEEGTFVSSSLKNTEVAGNLFVNNGKGEEMKQTLNAYPTKIEEILASVGITDRKFAPIALDAAEIDLFKNDSEAKNKSFVALNFVKSPVGAVMALISQYQNEVLNIESEALTTIANTIGSFYFKADITEAKISAVSNIVAAGTKFEGTMFIASSSSSATPTMTLDGRSVTVDERGFGQIEFTATPASQYDDRGLARRVLKGEIVTNIGGEDQVLPVEYEYFVAQPVVKVSSEVVQQLYADCANELLIEVPALGNTYAPEFSVSNGQSIKGNKPGQVTIIPGASGKVTIGVSSGGNKIDDVTFDIKPVPAPTIVAAMSNGSPVDLAQAQAIGSLTGLKILATPEPTFGRTMAKDANFEVTGGEVRLLRSDVPRQTIQISNGNSLAMRSLLESARPGDDIVVVVNQVTRTNFRGNKIPTSLNQIIRIGVK
ncbi:MAG TPA: gliding motility protein GldM [Algoriphagus sp.]|jgi:gliding motility-associated protein GldM|uniref:type IX secretion system motor protein PorM/GldM n=1 Tax=unclassified Algoriphagus TaxID=2641541 RepID=UPI000C584A50|nr:MULTISPECIES: gliding motility protein GldM [unclassified Algoriphagus]MAL12328.1 gliding motility protein GldM [Algoriphagus sp.]HAH35088.1 gliding motility protein GldM [Algoriphagus sp.]HAS59351.1 gliding motility protein GldM [Algoriphagus sp.]HAZ25655.1 gliding motility protein GldM [Algoriphagus sp.]HCD87916.1 gliding motility protein GldM [Algoriphagus sp.]|tara:strand:- start:5085 stop:6698 length:1614 start_codon:yes stop_codon:yes gene_type:complete